MKDRGFSPQKPAYQFNTFVQDKVDTYYSHWGHGCDRIDDGWDEAKFSCLEKNKKRFFKPN